MTDATSFFSRWSIELTYAGERSFDAAEEEEEEEEDEENEENVVPENDSDNEVTIVEPTRAVNPIIPPIRAVNPTVQPTRAVNPIIPPIQPVNPIIAPIQAVNDSVPAAKEANVVTEEQDKCLICLERSPNAAIIHGATAHGVCCKDCADKWFKMRKKCPTCNQKIEKVVQLFT